MADVSDNYDGNAGERPRKLKSIDETRMPEIVVSQSPIDRQKSNDNNSQTQPQEGAGATNQQRGILVKSPHINSRPLSKLMVSVDNQVIDEPRYPRPRAVSFGCVAISNDVSQHLEKIRDEAKRSTALVRRQTPHRNTGKNIAARIAKGSDTTASTSSLELNGTNCSPEFRRVFDEIAKEEFSQNL